MSGWKTQMFWPASWWLYIKLKNLEVVLFHSLKSTFLTSPINRATDWYCHHYSQKLQVWKSHIVTSKYYSCQIVIFPCLTVLHICICWSQHRPNPRHSKTGFSRQWYWFSRRFQTWVFEVPGLFQDVLTNSPLIWGQFVSDGWNLDPKHMSKWIKPDNINALTLYSMKHF